jgi:hypothetical protein
LRFRNSPRREGTPWMVDFVFLAAACLVGYIAQELVEPHPYAALEKARA